MESRLLSVPCRGFFRLQKTTVLNSRIPSRLTEQPACYGQNSHSVGFHSSCFSQKYFDKILIANRGEITCRVIRTCKKLGIKTVAIYSQPDANAQHVQQADEAVCVGPAPSSQSYLSIPSILEAVKKSGAQAVHPGYGFLSENHHFAQTLEEAGIVFIGPPSSAIRALGDKIESKKLAKKAQVNIVPGRLMDAVDVEDALKIAHEIGYPVMIKAASGGGGKGMRIAWNDKEAREGYRLSKSEALASFGDDRLLVEKYIDSPRHIEIQLLGDGKGNTLYFNERECSIQRRNQKVLEEAPSSFLDEKTRKAMGEQAVALANAVGYKSAGTCEFLVDPQRNFYFLEMNTRLQVEHPVTELITGYDLVELMIRVAAGEKLTIEQKDIPLKGWALEARVYAEDPLRNFLPSIGILHRYREPLGIIPEKDSEQKVRVDSGVREEDEISIHYDPLISKLITYGRNRTEAIDLMIRALDSYVIRGLNHNVCFLRAVMQNARFRQGDISTKFIPLEFPNGFQGISLNLEEESELIAIASMVHHMRELRNWSIDGKIESCSFSSDAHYVVTLNIGKDGNATKRIPVSLQSNEESNFQVSFLQEKKLRSITIDFDWPVDSFVIRCTLNHVQEADNLNKTQTEVIAQLMEVIPSGYRLQFHGTQFDVLVQTPREAELSRFMPVKEKIDTTKSLLSPMPGRMYSVSVKPGDPVTVGQELAIVEAMKMQNVLRASRDCTVKAVNVKAGQDVLLDQVLIEFS